MDRSKHDTDLGLQVSEDIVPIGEFKAHLSERIRELRARRRPLVVTLNGRASAVVLSPEAFDELNHRARVVRAVNDGLEQANAGKVIDHDEVFRRVEARIGKVEKAKRR
jgi:prevent-host-death family protein